LPLFASHTIHLGRFLIYIKFLLVDFWSTNHFITFWSSYQPIWLLSDQLTIFFDHFLITIRSHSFLKSIALPLVAFFSPYPCIWSLFDHYSITFIRFLISIPFLLVVFWSLYHSLSHFLITISFLLLVFEIQYHSFDCFLITISFPLVAFRSSYHCFWSLSDHHIISSLSDYQIIPFGRVVIPILLLSSLSDQHIFTFDRFLIIILLPLFVFWSQYDCGLSLFPFIPFGRSLNTRRFRVFLITISLPLAAFLYSYNCVWSFYDHPTIAFGGFLIKIPLYATTFWL
jgi:hypothetical protein